MSVDLQDLGAMRPRPDTCYRRTRGRTCALTRACRWALPALLMLASCQAPTGSMEDLAKRVEALELDHDSFDQRVAAVVASRGVAKREVVEPLRKSVAEMQRDYRLADSRIEKRIDLLDEAHRLYQSNGNARLEKMARQIDEMDRRPRDMSKEVDAIRQDYRALFAKLDETRMVIFKRIDTQYHQIEEGRLVYKRILDEERKVLSDKLAELNRAIEKLDRALPPISTEAPAIAPSAATQVSETRGTRQH